MRVRPSANAWNVTLFLALLVYVGIATCIVWIEFAFSADGIASVIGEAIGTLAILGLIAFAISFRKKTKFAYPVALTLSAALLVNSHWSGILDGYDAREYKAEVAKATPENVTEVLRNSKTRIGQMMNAVLTVTQKNQGEIDIFFQSLDDERFRDALTAETLRSPEWIASLSGLAFEKHQIAAKADEKLDTIFDKTYQEVEKSMQGISLSPGVQSKYVAGYKQSSEQLKRLLKEYARAYFGLYDNVLGLYGVLQRNIARYSVNGPGSVVLYNNDAVTEFNRYCNGLVNNSKEIADIRSKLAIIQKNAVNKLVHSTHN